MTSEAFDAVATSVMANKFEGIVREMTNTLLRTARSAVINSARDFSCAILTAEDELLAAAESIPTHIFGAQLQAAALREAHPARREGDAYLDNNPYIGNSHPADHTILVPVFIDGEHMFTAVAKAHQADIGNSIPTTYHASAKDVYEEGALIFPTVKVQEDYRDVADIIAMCQARIRVPRQWYGDYLAAVGSARIAERRLKQLGAEYGLPALRRFVQDWLDYSERVMAKAIHRLPTAVIENSNVHDAFPPFMPEELEIRVRLEIDSEAGRINVDLTENGPNVDCGLNLTEGTTQAAVFAGIFNAIPDEIPKNSGAFRRVTVQMNEGSAVGKPTFPHSCSLATTNVNDRLINCVGAAFAKLGEPYGLAEGAVGVGAGYAVISGRDARSDERFVNQLVVTANGGPGSPLADGWVTYGVPCVSGLMYRDSVEVDEVKMPIQYEYMRFVPDSGGPGKFRGGAAFELAYTARFDPISVIFPCDGQVNPSKGAGGGHNGRTAAAYLELTDGTKTALPGVANLILNPGETMHGVDASGGGYGDPLERSPEMVLADVLDGWETVGHARDVYGVAIDVGADGLIIDWPTTESLRRVTQSAE
jgi:N-methylhydantoinase B